MTRRVAAVPVAWASGAAFLAVFAGLAFQMRQGRDPVLGAGHDGASARRRPPESADQARREAARDRAGDPCRAGGRRGADGPLDAGGESPRWSRLARPPWPPPAARPGTAAGARDEDLVMPQRVRHDVRVDGQRRAAAGRGRRESAGCPRRRRPRAMRAPSSRTSRARLTRFDPSSELCALNSRCARRGAGVAAPARRRTAGLWAARAQRRARRSDAGRAARARRLRELAERGRRRSRCAEALAHAPPRRPAAPDPAAAWRSIVVDDRAGLVRRPPGVRFDTGGTGKGLAADAVATGSPATRGWSWTAAATSRCAATWEVEVEHPLTGERVHTLQLHGGGVATSGLNVRLWRRPDGSYAHHLLDPSTGEPAWTGLVGATAIGADGARGRDAVQARAPVGPARARAPRSPSTAGSSSTTTVTWS